MEELYQWPADLLADYVKAHHKDIQLMVSKTEADLAGLTGTYGHQGELNEAQALFRECARRMELHLTREAAAVLPFARRYTKALKKRKIQRKPALLSACPSIHRMYQEHKSEILPFAVILHLIRETALPVKDPCRYEQICKNLTLLKRRWQEQVQLENDIFFPKIVEMEATLYPM